MEIKIYHGHEVPEAKGVCVVIDVIRAFTTAAFAFQAGAKEIIFVTSVEEAFKKHKDNPSWLLMGERNGIKVDGFHYGNSPMEVKDANLAGKTMVQRTSSGTQGVKGCSHAEHMFIASFVVAEATLKKIQQLNPSHVSLIATGRKDGEEDLALAEYLKARLLGKTVDLIQVLDRVRSSYTAQRMLSGPISYPDAPKDLELILKIDHFPFAMEVFKEDQELIGRIT